LLTKAYISQSFFVVLLFISLSSFAQKTDFAYYESELLKIAPLLQNGKSDQEKLDANEQFVELWDYILDDPKSMKYDFDSLTSFPILTSKDKKIRIINWYIPLENNINKYYAIVQYYNNKKRYKVDYLKPLEGEVKSANTLKLNNNQWIGALYYHLSSFKRGKKTYYLLLGWDGNDERSNKKIMDVLTVSKSLTFGAPIFRYKKNRYHRFILEYKEDAAVSVRYNAKIKSIFFPQLIPLNDDLSGLYDFYVPDGSINAFELVNGSFKFKEDIINPNKVDVPKIKKLDGGLFPK
jgi:hypothetical protein